MHESDFHAENQITFRNGAMNVPRASGRRTSYGAEALLEFEGQSAAQPQL